MWTILFGPPRIIWYLHRLSGESTENVSPNLLRLSINRRGISDANSSFYDGNIKEARMAVLTPNTS